ncbi:glycine zipper 2TM domain-containing protein [Colwellia sp. MEBiC06753]
MMLLVLPFTASVSEYQRNKAVPVEKVLFGQVLSVRNISEQELIQDQANGWQVFGGALIGGAIGNQFGGGSGKVAATILGALLGANISEQRHSQQKVRVHQLVELMIKIDNGDEYMVIQDYDPKMLFQPQDKVRMIYLANDTVRIDLQQ